MIEDNFGEPKKSGTDIDEIFESQTCKTRETGWAENPRVICMEEEPCEKAIPHNNDTYCLRKNISYKYNGNRSKSQS